MKPGPTDKIYPVTGIATIIRALEAKGVAYLDALNNTDLSLQQLRSPETRVSLSQIIQCYRNAVRLSVDPYFAYHTGLQFHISTYGVYGFAILSGTDFRQTARFAEQFHHMTYAGADIKFKDEGDYGKWMIHPATLHSIDHTLYRFIVELYFGTIVSLSRDIMGPSFIPRELHVTYGPDMGRDSAAGVFDCPVIFGCKENALTLDRKWLDGPAELGNEVTYQEITKLCDQLMKEMQLRIGLAGSVRKALLVNLAQPMSFDTIARQLKISTRTLKRKLRQENTSYRTIVDELRTQLAIKYLRDTQLAIVDVASCLGFRDAASFRDAFRRWTKKTPSQFRRRIKASERADNDISAV